MKKLLGILVLGLLWCNVATSEILELGKDLKIRIPDNHEYVQYNYKKYLNALSKSLDKKAQKEIKKLFKEDAKILGLDGKEIITVIGSKGFGELYSSLVNHIIKKKKGEWEGYKIIEKECGEAGMIMLELYAQGETELTYELKKFTKCMAEVMKSDPIIYIYMANKTSKDVREWGVELRLLSKYIKRAEAEEDIKYFQDTAKLFAISYMKKSELSMDVKSEFVAIRPDDSGSFELLRFFYKYSYKTNLLGIEMNVTEYRTMYKNSVVSIGINCISKENCNKAEKLKKEIITPFFGSTNWD